MTTRDSMTSSFVSSKHYIEPSKGMLFQEGNTANPYVPPLDSKILDIAEERERRVEEREVKKHQKIWEKGLRYNRAGQLRAIDEIESSAPPDEQEPRFTVADAANAALVRDRVHTKENMTKVIEKKREMFLLQMMIDIKKEEIKKLEEYELVREDGLRSSENMLIDDMTEFNRYWDESKKKSHEAIKEADEENKAKIRKNAQIKQLTDQIQSISVGIQKNRDSLDECMKYKQFLDSITPNEFLARQQARGSDDEEEEKYFKDPKQIIEIFGDLIEDNLTFIQNIQEQEQTLEESKKKFDSALRELEKKLTILKSTKDDMQSKINEKSQKWALVEQRISGQSSENFMDGDIYRRLENEIRKLYNDESGVDEVHQPPIKMLKSIEKKFFGYLDYFEDLSKTDPKYIPSQIEQKEKQRRAAFRLAGSLEKKKKDLERALAYSRRAEGSKGKTYGRPMMKKCRLPEKKKKVVVKKIDSDEEDMRDFLNE